MRFLMPTAVFLGLVCLTLSTPGSARAGTPTAAAVDGGSAAVGSQAGYGGRIGDGKVVTPDWFGSKWWKKFTRAMKRFLEFIDGLIDDLRGHPGDEPSGRFALNDGPGHAPFPTPVSPEALRI